MHITPADLSFLFRCSGNEGNRLTPKIIPEYQVPAEEDVREVEATKDMGAIVVSPPTGIQTLPREILLQIVRYLSAAQLISFGLASTQALNFILTHSGALTNAITNREKKRLETTTDLPRRPNYEDLAFLDALILWCSYWGIPHHIRHRDACDHFVRDFNNDNGHLQFGCIPLNFRLLFWSFLAQFLLCVSSRATRGQEHGRSSLTPDRWVEAQANAQFTGRWDSGQSFLREVVDMVTKRSSHFCLSRLISNEQWSEMVRSVCENPIREGGLSIVTLHATYRHQLWDAVKSDIGNYLSLSTFLEQHIGLPVCPRGFRYVPLAIHDTDRDVKPSLEGVPATQAAKLARLFCEWKRTPDAPVGIGQLLRAAMMETIDVCDTPFDIGIHSIDRCGTVWRTCVERYGEKSLRARNAPRYHSEAPAAVIYSKWQ